MCIVIRLRQNLVLSIIPVSSNRLRFKLRLMSNQILMKFLLMLKLCMLISVSQVGVNEVDTTHFFSSQDTWKDIDDLLSWIRWQANMAGFTGVIQRSNLKNPMLELMCERGGDHKVHKKRLKHESTWSRKCWCMFKLCGYVRKEAKDWKLVILNEVHNHEMATQSSMGRKLHKSEETSSWEFDFLDQHTWFRDLMNIEKGDKPSPKKKKSQTESI